MISREEQINQLKKDWSNNPRWKGVLRSYNAEEVVRLRPSLLPEYTIAQHTAKKFWAMLHGSESVFSLGCMTGNQAIQCVQAGLKAIYCSGWQVAADQNSNGDVYPDQSLYSADSVPKLVEKINNSLMRADQVNYLESKASLDWYAPIIADAEAGFGGNLNAFELGKHIIKAGAAAIHLEDQLSSVKKCGHMGGKVVVPTQEAIQKLLAVRLASDVYNVPTVVIARTDINGAKLITSDVDRRDHAILTGERSSEGYFFIKNGIEAAIQRGLSYAPYADMIWCETSSPDLEEAKLFAEGIHKQFPGKLLAYNCSPSFNWNKYLNPEDLAVFREKLFELGYVFQFITLAGWHTLNLSMFEIALACRKNGMLAYAQFQKNEALAQDHGFNAVKHQSFVGAGYFDAVQNTITQEESALNALTGSTEHQFK